MEESFWPNFDNPNINILNPEKLLIEQGIMLEKISKGVLTYDINKSVFEHEDSPSKRAFRIDFYIHAPLISDYKFLLFYIIHDFIITYPISLGYFKAPNSNTRKYEVQNYDEYKNQVKQLIGLDSTKEILESLYMRSTSMPKA